MDHVVMLDAIEPSPLADSIRDLTERLLAPCFERKATSKTLAMRFDPGDGIGGALLIEATYSRDSRTHTLRAVNFDVVVAPGVVIRCQSSAFAAACLAMGLGHKPTRLRRLSHSLSAFGATLVSAT